MADSLLFMFCNSMTVNMTWNYTNKQFLKIKYFPFRKENKFLSVLEYHKKREQLLNLMSDVSQG
jgi:hypothetical protein